MRPDGERRFDAVIEIDAGGRVAIRGFSPIGTTLFRIFVDDGRALLLNDRERTWWEGSFAELTRRTGLFRSAPGIDADALARLLFGIPADAVPFEGEWTTAPSGIRYRTARTGLIEVAGPDGEARITYLPPVWPPARVRLETPSSGMTIDHQEIVWGVERIDVPEPDPSWTRER